MKSNEERQTVTPKLRFPEFRDGAGWELAKLKDISEPVTERVGKRKLTPVSISAGIGFVPQAEKFGRDISGNQYELYTVVKDGQFVFNKGNSTKFPQGCIYLLDGWGEVAAPNVFICFQFLPGFANGYFQQLFEANFHGMQLKKHITSGARSNGLLNISKETFFNISLPIPTLPEQTRIADCLSFLDALIAAQTQKLDALRTHKQGLMQQLFPAEGERTPRLRFKEFEGAGEWEEKKLGKLLLGQPTYGVNAPAVPFSEELPAYLRITDISEDGYFLREKKSSVDIFPMEDNYLKAGDIVLARTGASVGKSYRYRQDDGNLVFAGFLIRVRPNPEKLDSVFLFNFLTSKQYWEWVKVTSARSGQPGINGNEYASLAVPHPRLPEQQRIADCLSSLDQLISAQSDKIAELKTFKRGLMQQLFPAPEQEGGG